MMTQCTANVNNVMPMFVCDKPFEHNSVSYHNVQFELVDDELTLETFLAFLTHRRLILLAFTGSVGMSLVIIACALEAFK